MPCALSVSTECQSRSRSKLRNARTRPHDDGSDMKSCIYHDIGDRLTSSEGTTAAIRPGRFAAIATEPQRAAYHYLFS